MNPSSTQSTSPSNSTSTPACPTCAQTTLKSAGGVCEGCLRKGLRAHQQLLARYRVSLQHAQAKAGQWLAGPQGESRRKVKAELGSQGRVVELAKEETRARRASCLTLRDQLAARRTSLQQRHENLQHATHKLHSNHPIPNIEDPFQSDDKALSPAAPTPPLLLHQWQSVAAALTEARQSACIQAMDTWHVQVVDELDPGTKEGGGHVLCKIAGCILPSIRDLKQYPPDEIMAAVGHTAYLVRLLVMYLGVRLPFSLQLGARSTIKAAPFTAWQEKFSASSPLFISAAAVKQAAESSTQPSISSPSSTSTSSNPAARALTPFVTALSMLTYDIYFLCCSALRFPLTPQLLDSGALHVLLCAIQHFTAPAADERELSKRSRSHATAYRPLTELNLVVAAAASAGSGQQEAMVVGFPTLLQDNMAALVEATSSTSASTTTTTTTTSQGQTKQKKRKEAERSSVPEQGTRPSAQVSSATAASASGGSGRRPSVDKHASAAAKHAEEDWHLV